MLNIVQKIDEYLLKERQIYPQHTNRASSAGHPCARKLVYERLNWQDKTLPSLGLERIFREGREQERSVLKLLTEAGIEIIEQQRPFEWRKIQLTGHIDGRIKFNGDSPPLEIKGLNQFDFDKINTEQDLLKSPKHWLRGYPAQMQLYLLMAEEPVGVLLLKNKTSGELKQLTMAIDYEYAEEIIKKLELVNQYVATKSYPERIADKLVCERCDFKHICLPDECSESLELSDNGELIELLNQREQLRPGAKEYEEVNDRLKDIWEHTKEGTYLVGGQYQVKIKMQNRTFCNPPPDIKEKYMETSTYTKATIVNLKNQQ